MDEPPRSCPGSESDRLLSLFRRAHGPPMLPGRCRRDWRPASFTSTIWLSEIRGVASANSSGMRTRTSTNRFKGGLPAISDPRAFCCRGGESPGNRTPFADLRGRCFASKACDPMVPPIGLEPTQSGLKDRCPSCRAPAGNPRAPWVCVRGRLSSCVLVQSCPSLESNQANPCGPVLYRHRRVPAREAQKRKKAALFRGGLVSGCEQSVRSTRLATPCYRRRYPRNLASRTLGNTSTGLMPGCASDLCRPGARTRPPEGIRVPSSKSTMCTTSSLPNQGDLLR